LYQSLKILRDYVIFTTFSLKTIQANTRKKVIAVEIPRVICKNGISLKSLVWTVKGGKLADYLLTITKQKYILVKLIAKHLFF